MKTNKYWRLTVIPLMPLLAIGFLCSVIWDSFYAGWILGENFLMWVGTKEEEKGDG